MILKPRPMAEAPLGEKVIIVRSDGVTGCYVKGQGVLTGGDWVGFYTIADLLRAAEIVEKFTPEGYTYSDLNGVQHHGNSCSRTIFFRKLAPPVRYEFVTDEEKRWPIAGDWIDTPGGWFEIKPYDQSESRYSSQRCFRRVEVKP